MKTSNEVDEKFKKAIDALSAYEKRYHTNATMARWPSTAEARDECSVTILKTWRWPERLPVTLPLPYTNTDFGPSVPVGKKTTTVEFLINRSLIDDSRIIVKREPAHRCGLRY